jgi:hypothetical protein
VAGSAAVTGNIRGGSINSDTTIAAGTDITAGGNITAGGDVTGQNVNARANLTAGGNLRVNGSSTLGDATNDPTTVSGDLSAYRLNLDAKVFGTDIDGGGARDFGGGAIDANITLGDLLPRQVAQYSYLVSPGQAVAKPTCRGGYGRARIMVYRQIDSSQSTPNVPLIVQYGSGNGVGPFVGGVAVDSGSSWVRVSQGVIANDNGATWTVNWVGDPQAPNTTRQAIAQTFCYYGKA